MNSWNINEVEKKLSSPRAKRAGLHPSSISLSNVSFCVPILGSKNVTCLSDGPALHGFQIRTLTYSFLRELAAPVIWKVRVLCYEFTDVTLAWEDGQWVEAHKIILAGCSPKKKHPNPHVWAEWFLFLCPGNKNGNGKQVTFLAAQNSYLGWDNWREVNGIIPIAIAINTRYYGSKEDYDKDAQTKYDNSRRYRDPISINDRWIKFAKFAALRHLYLLLT